jgi:arginase
MGHGPEALLAAGLLERLARDGVPHSVTDVAPQGKFLAEIATTFDLQRGVRRRVEASLASGARPIVLSGNCNTGVAGSLAAHASDDVGLVWFDAHSDAETPETTTSGFLDGMGLAMALRCCWRAALGGVGDWALDGSRTALIGAREISPAAGELLRQQGVAVVGPADARKGAIGAAVDQLRASGARRIHLHVDLDVLDSALVGPANSYAMDDGLTIEQLVALIGRLGADFVVATASIASYDPEVDRSGAIAAAGVEIAALIASL